MVDLAQFKNPNGYYNCVALRQAAGRDGSEPLFFALFGSTDELAAPPILPGEWQAALEEADQRNEELRLCRAGEWQALLDAIPANLVEQVANNIGQEVGGAFPLSPALAPGAFARRVELLTGLNSDMVWRAGTVSSPDSENYQDLVQLSELNPTIYQIIMARKLVRWEHNPRERE